jgi:hypothetical protein
MAKTSAISVRISEQIKLALEAAAKDDVRSVSSMLEKLVTEWLRKNGYLPADP